MYLFNRMTILLFAFLFISVSHAADHIVPSSVTSITASGCTPTACNGAIQPGDTITLASGNRGRLTIRDIIGTASQPVIIRNSASGSGPTVFLKPAGMTTGFILTIESVNYVVLDGTNKWSGASTGGCAENKVCGIKVTLAEAGPPTAFIKVGGSTKNFTMKGVEVDGKFPTLSPDGLGIGLSVNDHTYKLAAGRTQLNPNEWRENILITDNYIHDNGSECLYVGANFYPSQQADLPLRNIEISYNRVERCVRDGINLKSTIGGVNRVHHNKLRDIGMGLGGESTDRSGIAVFEGYADIYANHIDAVYLNGAPSGGNCITTYTQNRPNTYGPFNQKIYSNLCVDPENHGINVGRPSTSEAMIVPTITHNTIISAAAKGINISSAVSGGVIRDNIIVGSGASNISAPSGSTVTNNFVGTVASQNFLNAAKKDFHLTSTSPARNAGTVNCVPLDLDDISRPQGSGCDAGAYEFFEGQTAPTLKAPQAVRIQ